MAFNAKESLTLFRNLYGKNNIPKLSVFAGTVEKITENKETIEIQIGKKVYTCVIMKTCSGIEKTLDSKEMLFIGALSSESKNGLLFFASDSSEDKQSMLNFCNIVRSTDVKTGFLNKNALDEINLLTGLDDFKSVMHSIFNNHKMECIAKSRGISVTPSSYHIIFKGNPGTGKTTMAKQTAKFLYEIGVLRHKDPVIVGRSSLVGEHCGETAIKTKNLINSSKGKLLFIDEAYSLLEDREGGFGDEAINTMVSMLDEVRNDVVVVLAGYPEKMSSFLKSNPGLSSRFRYHITFDDYSPTQLCAIIRHMAEKSYYKISEDSYDILFKIFKEESRKEDFGNGRFARNLFETAVSCHAEDVNFDEALLMSDDEIFTLTNEDFSNAAVLICSKEKTTTTVLGFK